MSKNLVIVESPAKAKTIEKYLGKDFVVKSSIGHIRRLPSRDGSIDVGDGFRPVFEIDPDKKKTIAELKKAAKAADTVWLASDEDREGEAIAWHLCEVLGLDPQKTKRIVFHEITKSALEQAIHHPRSVDMPLVEAQQARQALDYLVGFELSPVLWRKVGGKLSAGRVQSVAVRLIVDRERDIEAHVPASSFKITADMHGHNEDFKAESRVKYDTAAEVKAILETYAGGDFTVSAIEKKPGTRSPSAPFTTSTLQQEAGSRLGYSPRTTMQLAQRLYEAGHITYMRTDSMNLSGQFLSQATHYIEKEYGANYHQVRTYKTKSSGAQEAHEAIRPTNPAAATAGADEQQKKLYSLIWRRTLASQMTNATVEKTEITLTPHATSNIQHPTSTLVAKGEIVTFDGFLRVYGRSGDDTILPDLSQGDSVTLKHAESLETLSRGPARYTEATLVRALEERGIGRPSTYASIISTIQSRDYVERADVEGTPRTVTKLTLDHGIVTETPETIQYGKDSNKLLPTDRGIVVTDFLVKHFSDVMEYDFTKQIETELDEIAERKKQRIEVLKAFYTPFHDLIEKSSDISRSEASQARLVGQEPGSGAPIYARFGKYGPMLQKGEQSDDPKPQFAPLPQGSKIDTVTLEQALQMFRLPRTVGQTSDGREIRANIGRFGPYIQIEKTFVSIKPLDPHTITETEARALYDAKLQADAAKNIADFGDGIKVLVGRFGPYITDGTKNAKIPKDTDPKSISHDEAKKLLTEAPAKGKSRFRRKTK